MLEKEREKEVQSYFDKLAKDAIQRSASGNEKAANPIGSRIESTLTAEAVEAPIQRIKVMAKLDIAEKRLPQDGRISVRVGGKEVDVRVSTIPASNGERVVMRLLDKAEGRRESSRP